MKPANIYSKLALLCVLLMGMGFPTVMPEEDSCSDCGERRSSGHYVKVGFLACSRQVSEVEQKEQTPTTGCVEKTKKTGSENTQEPPDRRAPLADNAQIITQHVCWLVKK